MDEPMNETARTPPFAPFEWLLSGRYLRARRKEGFISVIAGFSFLGIMLGVATLIIVMAVMNGFRNELFAKILGLNGHIIVNKIGGQFDDRAGQCLGVGRRHEKARSTLVDHFGQTLYARSNDRLAHRHGFGRREAKGFPQRGHGQNVNLLQESDHVALPTDELDDVVDF